MLLYKVKRILLKLRILRWGGYAGISGEPDVITRPLQEGNRRKVKRVRKDVTTVAKLRVM